MELVSSDPSAKCTNLIYSSLTRSPIFSGVDRTNLYRLAAAGTLCKASKNEFILRQGYEVRSYYLITKGMVSISLQSICGKSIILGVLKSGDTLGDTSIFNNIRSLVSAQALTVTSLVAFKQKDLLHFYTHNPVVAMRIRVTLAKRLSELADTILDLLAANAQFRVAKSLIMLCDQFGEIIPFNHQQVADMAGITRETASKILGELARHNTIRSLRGSIAILDRDALRLDFTVPEANQN